MPKISVIVPVYKVEKYLNRCVDSILAQTFRDFELILVDDGSPDNCGRICDEYAQKDPRIIVIHQENGGLSAARNAGLDWAFANSDSEWLSFIDSDDWVVPTYLADLYDAVQFPGVDVSMGCIKTIIGDEVLPAGTDENEVFQISGREACCCIYNFRIGIYKKCRNKLAFVQSWNKLYRKSLFVDVRFPVGKIHEDQGTTYKLLYRAEKVAIIPRVLYGYTINPAGIMGSGFSIRRFDNIFFLREAESFFRRNGEPEIASYAAERGAALQSTYTLEARRNKIYQTVPREYQMGNLIQQIVKMNRILSRDEYEYVMYPYYPKLAQLQCRLWKITDILTQHKSK